MTGSTERTVLVVNGRVHEVPAGRSVDRVRLESSVAWWTSLGIFGGLLAVLGVLVGTDLGVPAAIGGVSLFFATAVLAGDERYEIATALGSAGVLWTSLGIAVDLGTDPARSVSFVVLASIGIVAMAAGVLGGLRRKAGERRR